MNGSLLRELIQPAPAHLGEAQIRKGGIREVGVKDLCGDRCGDGPDPEAREEVWDRSLVDQKRSPQTNKSSLNNL